MQMNEDEEVHKRRESKSRSFSNDDTAIIRSNLLFIISYIVVTSNENRFMWAIYKFTCAMYEKNLEKNKNFLFILFLED